MEPHISDEASGLLITKGFGLENRANREMEIDFHPYGDLKNYNRI